MDPISQFLTHYTREYDYYSEVGRLAQAQLSSALDEAGIRAIVTSRAKSANRLESKCIQRHARTPYESLSQIYGDIVDLVGVRVALYFPGELPEVDAIVSQLFNVHEPRREFPRDGNAAPDKRFSGYSAVHYRASIPEGSLAAAEHRYSLARIEIQVASVLMHAWSEVEHDLVYKPLTGELAEDERAILDQLNGLVLAGEIALERLQEAGRRRVLASGTDFANHYDLASYVFGQTSEKIGHPITDEGAGRVDLLFELLRKLGKLQAADLDPYLSAVHGDLEQRPLADQLVDALIEEDAGRYALYRDIRKAREVAPETESREYEAAGMFLSKWREFEHLLHATVPDNVVDRTNIRPITAVINEARARGIVDDIQVDYAERLRRIRNNLVHGREIKTSGYYEEASVVLASLNEHLKRLAEPPTR